VFRVPGHVPHFADASTTLRAGQSVRSAGILPAVLEFEEEARSRRGAGATKTKAPNLSILATSKCPANFVRNTKANCYPSRKFPGGATSKRCAGFRSISSRWSSSPGCGEFSSKGFSGCGKSRVAQPLLAVCLC